MFCSTYPFLSSHCSYLASIFLLLLTILSRSSWVIISAPSDKHLLPGQASKTRVRIPSRVNILVGQLNVLFTYFSIRYNWLNGGQTDSNCRTMMGDATTRPLNPKHCAKITLLLFSKMPAVVCIILLNLAEI